MATYVNDLRLKEIGTGESSGTWGSETNTNLELIGEALGFGTEAITTNADTHTTTVADGSTDPGRAMYLKYTGALDSNCTITIAPNTMSRMHFIENATTDSGSSGPYSIIISQGTGANVTIPNGDVKAVYLDGAGSGAAVVDAFASLSTVDLKVQDDLTVTDDMTVGGTLGVTGIVTLTDDLIIGDGKTIGSASDVDAMTIASNGQVTFTQTLIGTALDISGDIDVDGTTNLDVVDIDGALTQDGGAVFNEASADVDFRVESNGQTHAFYVDGGTNAMGIGTTPPTDSHTGWNQVFIGQKGSLISENATGTHGIDGMHITDNLYMDADTGSFANIETNESSAYRQEAGIHKFFSQASGSAGAAVTLAEQARITTDGIALSTNKYFGDSSDTDNYLQFNQANTFRFVTGDVTSLTSTASELTINQDSANLDTRIESDDNANMFIVDAGGNDVRIGSATSYVSANLQVTQNDGTEKHLIALSSGADSVISGSGQSAKFGEGVVAVNTTSAGNTLTIPITSQTNLWRQYQVELMVASAEYNSSSAQARGGTATFGLTSLSSLNIGNVVVTGNISGVTVSSMNVLVEFSTAFTSGLNDYEGCVMHYKVIGITPEYFQGWAATLD